MSKQVMEGKSSLLAGYKVVVGLEVHIQLQTKTKLFAADLNAYGAPPNTNVSVITLAHPGIMPMLNKKAVEYAIMMGLACNSSITKVNFFDRKNYFYPDLPKGWQTTQDKTPICVGGKIAIRLKSGEEKELQLNRIHLEEDAGKSIHPEGASESQIDLNRAGVPLIELVTEPVLSSSEEAYCLLNEIRKIVDYLQICDGNMEEGSLRCDANISVMKEEDTELGKKVEIKNMNSVRNVARAIDYEAQRQVNLLRKGDAVISETRLFDAEKGTTSSMRTKEELNDYRYFPEPDLSPFEVSDEWLKAIERKMPSLPQQLYHKFTTQYNLPAYNAAVLTESKELASYFEDVCQHCNEYKAISNWLMGPVSAYLKSINKQANAFVVAPGAFAKLVQLVEGGKVSFSTASKSLLPAMIESKGAKDAHELAKELGIIQDASEDSIRTMVREILEAHPDKVKAYQNGKKGLLGMFMGEVMKKSKGSLDPKQANTLILEALEEK